MKTQNGILEDISAEIGYTATTTLVDYLGGQSLYVPQEPTQDHLLAKLLGFPAFRALCKSYGNETINLPFDYRRERNQRNRLIGALIERGVSIADIARTAGISTKQVGYVKVELEEIGMLTSLSGVEELYRYEPDGVSEMGEFEVVGIENQKIATS